MKIEVKTLNVNIHIHQSSPMADAMVKAAIDAQEAQEMQEEENEIEFLDFPDDAGEKIQEILSPLRDALEREIKKREKNAAI